MADPIISQEVDIEMLEKLSDGTFKIKYPKTKADLVIGLTKGHVGLGNVQNYGIATQAEAEAGTSNNKYMTPLRVAQAMDVKVPKMVTGKFTVAAGSTKSVTLGFTPKYVEVYTGAQTSYFNIYGVLLEGTSYGTISPNARIRIEATADGFTVENQNSSTTYGCSYLAF